MKRWSGIFVFVLLIFGMIFVGLARWNLGLHTQSEKPQMPSTAQPNPAAQPTTKTELLISADTSLKESLLAVQAVFQKENPDIQLQMNFGASGQLEQQIQQGAQVDLFLSAGQKQMDDLLKQQRIDADSKTNVVQNQLVVITPKSGAALSSLDDLVRPDIKKVAVGDPASVPVGTYAKQSLEFYNSWDSMQSKLVFTKDVGQIISDVESGNADAGIVYKTDAMTSQTVQVACVIPDQSHSPILYAAGIVSTSKHKPAAKRFAAFLKGEEAKRMFQQYGFTINQS
jgi:molybdate transport system substrate-binding protein